MDWFTRIEGVDELGSAQSFFDFFELEVDPLLLRSRHLHIMAQFNQRLTAAVPVHVVNEEESDRADWRLARRLLAESYQHTVAGPLNTQSVLAVYQRNNGSFIDWNELLEVRP
ncbi:MULTISPECIES: nitrogenase-stabilizing/protective protein NifW [Rahnella]|uniref:Nitrogenase-stabilizing/protective protein NifW n=1 Tax=Rahnella victoriana TaxID=1510570 RepID=A0ABS0DV35_9GAMM|nr:MULTISPECIES: nitrogenase-stabilizing/protective protein NifW [Rahnella]MBF7957700.1 nitrogenase-stabilizing/protective protein NifW [Rahnella victoriana]TDS97999.1 nitrogenase-stabilizing/protective protein [Rahnella sp. BIGb0236]VTQ52422.1 Nitrogenase-stabilizing/protective protein nifW [Campylobacter jejuni]